MAHGANVTESVLYGIVRRGKGARPDTLKKIADTWGDENDYLRLLELAGHPLPETTHSEDSREAILEEIMRLVIEADVDTRIEYLRMAREILDDDDASH
jgi:hypothetical protein